MGTVGSDGEPAGLERCREFEGFSVRRRICSCLYAVFGEGRMTSPFGGCDRLT